MQMPGEQGMDAMKALMANFRCHPPRELGGMKLARVRDYLNDTVTAARRQARRWTARGATW